MYTIFCDKCGQANLPNSNYCSKCNNFIKPRTTIEIPSVKTKGETTIYWIAGGALIVIILGTFVFSVLGAGTYLYIAANRNQNNYQPKHKDYPIEQPKKEQNIEQPKKEQNEEKPKVTNTESKDDVLSKISNDDVQKYINGELGKVGKFRLTKTGTPKPFFIGAKTEQYGFYSSDESKDSAVLFIMATFPTVSDSKDFYEKKIDQVNRDGGEVKYRKNNDQADWLIYRTKDEGVQIMKCSKGICVNVQSTSGNDTADFFEAYEARGAR